MSLFDKISYMFNKEDVYIGYSLDEVSKILNILNKNNIKYTHKVIKNLKSSERFSLERVVANMDYETQYTISVKESDCEQAKYLVNRVLHT
jgi:hypothetical protein